MQENVPPKPSSWLNIGLWIAQIAAGALFALFGILKLTRPIADLAQTMHWAGQFPEAVVRVIGAVDLAGGLGLILPAATRIAPRLTVLAALGCCALQLCAIAFHLVRGEVAVLPLNFVLLALASFIFWGRWKRARIQPRV